mgnify:CR=1 FL=1
MKKTSGILMVLTLLCSLSLVEAELTEQKKASCNRWAYRFLSIKDGANFMNNRISAKKFPKYVDLCLENYDALQRMYNQKSQAN